jgi:parallel beta-helix repeat protein
MRLRSRFTSGAAGLVLVAGAVTLWAGPTLADGGNQGPGGGGGQTLYVSNSSGTAFPGPGAWSGSGGGQPGWAGGALRACASASYTTISSAVSAASSGDTIVVCPGFYSEGVVVPAGKPLTINGVGNPTVNALGLDNGVQVLASGTTIEGLRVAYATGEGILVGSLPGAGSTVKNVTIRDNIVFDNDRGNPTGAPITTAKYAECNAQAGVPGDCGEGIHLLSADHSAVSGNYVTANSGGILLTDENGPTDGNTIQSNTVANNTYDCGITVAGHQFGTSTDGGKTWSTVLPSVGGVFNNVIRDNQSIDNGVLAQGGGILLATGVPGGAVYNNLVEHNSLSGNGLAGVTVHSHSPGEDLNGNVIRGNNIGTNNLDGDPDFFPLVDTMTTGVIVATAVNPISIAIKNNVFNNNYYGIWTTPNVTVTATANTFVGVNTPIFTAS